ncbi:unnamed protein product [Closterium sp. NIES-64]|nr:unnamed protein product [Closterium sp. NIES-64]
MIHSNDSSECGAKLQFAAPDYRPPAGRSRRRSFNEPSFESWRVSRPISDSGACLVEPAAYDPSSRAPSALSSPAASGSSSPVAVPRASSSSNSHRSPPSAAVAFPTSLSSPVGSPQFSSFLSSLSPHPLQLNHPNPLIVPPLPSRSIDFTVTDGASRSSFESFGSTAADPLSPAFTTSASPPCPSSPSYHCVFPSPPPSPPSERHDLTPFLFENPQKTTISPSLEPYQPSSPFQSAPQSPHGRGIRSLGSSPRGSSALTAESERLGGSCRWTGGPSNPPTSSASPAGVSSASARRRSMRHLPPLAQEPPSAASSFAVVTATAALAEARRLKRASSSSSGLEGKGGFSFHHPAATPSPPLAAPSQRLSSTHPRFHRRHGSASSSSGSGLLPALGLPTPPRDSASRPAAVVTAAADSAEPLSPESSPTPSASSRGYSPRSALSSFGAKPIPTRRSGSGGGGGSSDSSRGIISSGAIRAFDPLDEASSPPNALSDNGALSLFDAPLAQPVAGGTSHAVSHFPVDRGSGVMRVGQREDSLVAAEESERRGAIETRYRNALNEPRGTGSGGEARKNRFLGGPRKSRTFDVLPRGAGEESNGGTPVASGPTGLGTRGDSNQRRDGHSMGDETAATAFNGGVEGFKRIEGSAERVIGGAGPCAAAGAAADRYARQARGAGLQLRRGSAGLAVQVESTNHHSQQQQQQQQVYGSGHDAAAERGGERGRRLLKTASSHHLDPAPSLASPALLTPRERWQLLKSGSGRWGGQGGSGSTSRGGSGSGRKGEGEEADDERSREIPLLSSPGALRPCVPAPAHSPTAFRRPPPRSPPRNPASCASPCAAAGAAEDAAATPRAPWRFTKAKSVSTDGPAIAGIHLSPSPPLSPGARRHALELPPSPPRAPAAHRHLASLKLSLAFLDALDSPPAADVALGGGGSSSRDAAHVQCHADADLRCADAGLRFADADSDVGGGRTGQVGGRLNGRMGGSMTDMYGHMESVGVAPEREVRGQQAMQEPRLQQWQQRPQRSLVGDSAAVLPHAPHSSHASYAHGFDDAMSAHWRRSMGGAADVESGSRRGGLYQEQGDGDYNESNDAWEQKALHESMGWGRGGQQWRGWRELIRSSSSGGPSDISMGGGSSGGSGSKGGGGGGRSERENEMEALLTSCHLLRHSLASSSSSSSTLAAFRTALAHADAHANAHARAGGTFACENATMLSTSINAHGDTDTAAGGAAAGAAFAAAAAAAAAAAPPAAGSLSGPLPRIARSSKYCSQGSQGSQRGRGSQESQRRQRSGRMTRVKSGSCTSPLDCVAGRGEEEGALGGAGRVGFGRLGSRVGFSPRRNGLGIGGARNGRKWDEEEEGDEEGDEEGEGGEEGGWEGGESWSGLAGAEGGGAEKEWRVWLAKGMTAASASAAVSAAAAGGTGGGGFSAAAAAAAASGVGDNAGNSGGGNGDGNGDAESSFRECVLGMPYEAVQRRYHVVRGRIGEGMFGRIHTCVERSSRRTYACKSISKKKLQCLEDAGDVRQEVVMLHMLKGHPHIIGLKEVLEDPKSIHLIMDLCSGGDLFDAVKARKHLPEPLAARLLQQLVGALLHCHATGIVHRDVKPENILLVSSSSAAARRTASMGSGVMSAMSSAGGGGEGSHGNQLVDEDVADHLGSLWNRGATVGGTGSTGSFLDRGECDLHIKLIDFGVAAFLDHDGMCRHTAGTTEYMAPEVLSGGRYSPQVDVWSAGVVLFVMLSGVLPFWPSHREGRSTEDAVLRQPLRFGHFRWAAVSGAAKDLVARMLTRDPDKRISALQVLGRL